MSSCVCALIEKGTSWTVDARLVAVTMITSFCDGSLASLTACACASPWVCAHAGVATARAAALINRLRTDRARIGMEIPPVGIIEWPTDYASSRLRKGGWYV